MFSFNILERLFVSSHLLISVIRYLIQEGEFSNGDDLIGIWDQAHVYEAKAKTAVQRHRLRKRFVEQYLVTAKLVNPLIHKKIKIPWAKKYNEL